ncbi:LamB/YcsF family protein [Caproiciproducens sp. NJN-50]|uniref:LamB/YcsF family protein n=1 Tax=Acutalibacteraceae TaxID=3082771 RepID=UPI000FFE18A5|nr:MULTISPECIES: 5-oxoprolinase subunit PxpA [Acutalibacteraceae]QAT49167.1 LamB/YcsF family protein [Caproiciproducens sp. NJN-50]
MNQIDLNCDLGESFGTYKLGMDEEVIPFVSSANVACGFHASDPVVMRKTVELAGKNGVCIGAHPGFPDLMGFGRRNMKVSPLEAKAYVQYQIGALDAFCRAFGVKLVHVKPHGALYNMAGKDYDLARAICEGIAEIDGSLILLALSGSEMIRAAKDTGLRAASEVFADRAYEEDGSLVARTKPNSMITDENEAIRRVVRMAKEGTVTAVTGKEIPIQADSVCVHGDNAKALDFVQKIRSALTAEGIKITPLPTICLKGPR